MTPDLNSPSKTSKFGKVSETLPNPAETAVLCIGCL